MATLTRPKTAPSAPAQSNVLSSGVPAPFSRDELDQIQLSGSFPSQLNEEVSITVEDIRNDREQSEEENPQEGSTNVQSDLIPSISCVQRSCIMTLNDLLSSPTHWNPIVPDRRHSMPTSPQSSNSHQPQADSSSSALQTLVLNLRQRQVQGEMVQVPDLSSDTELFLELRHRVESLSVDLLPRDATLAQALVSLLTHFNRLSNIYATSRHSVGRSLNRDFTDNPELLRSVDLFDTLKRQLSDLQVERLTSQPGLLPKEASPVLTVESALLWTRIDEELEKVVALCKERTENLPRFSLDYLPPQYDETGYDEAENPPEYDMNLRPSLDEPKMKTTSSQQTQLNTRLNDEKMRMDLEAVTMAIDRLCMVAPQLHNQRVELKSSKLAELERARREGESSRSGDRHGKQKERDAREMENLLDLLGKASDRVLRDQAVIIEGGMQGRLEKARQKDLEKRDAFVEKLARHSSSRRIHDQDAMPQPRTKDPNALLTLPEFIREAVPPEMIKSDPRALLSLPEFVKEPPPQHLVPSEEEQDVKPPSSHASKLLKKSRNRSSSAPPLSWLRPSSSKGSTSRPKSRGQNMVFDVLYVAENYENLHHILVYFTASGATPGVDIEAEVPSLPLPQPSESGCEFLQLRSGTMTSGQLLLPGYTTVGKKDVKVQGSHFEVKLPTISKSSSSSTPLPASSFHQLGGEKALLDASQLSSSSPTTFICASCSLPLIHSAKINGYRDLPSEHWEELVEAWMCHSDQKLHEHVVRHGKHGFWPQQGQALVGGSYILFHELAVNQNNLYSSQQRQLQNTPNWTLVRCLCGNVVGRCQRHDDDNGSSSMMYRMLKYAIRPVSPTSEPMKIPLTAFIVGDMMEYVTAHATYRFVIRDEEEERARILIWLFKPSMRISYSTTSSRIIPKTGSILAAKVLFKLLGPADASTDLKIILARYPGFPQAEYLSYPMDVCQRLAVILKETNSVYPDHMRSIADLEVGWLRRV
ncbi:E3 ubiquitin-protein ligase E3D [Leucoagaricus sp. SymC.cos]|nr:E3 ubiquitin-protein ligase E3D [Leucoagaricus sp. SymC.cos]